MDSKFIKSHQCSLERSPVVLTEINPEFCSRPGPFSTNTDSERSTSHMNLQKQNNEDFLFNYSMLVYFSTIATSGATFPRRTPPFFGCQTINLPTNNQQ